MAKKKLEVATVPQYEWQAEDAIPLTGKEWEILYNGITFIWENAIQDKPVSMKDHLALNDLKNVANIVFNKAVEQGVIKQK